MDDLKRIQQITQYYPELQGLRTLPLGLFFLVIALQWLNLLPWLGLQGNLSLTLPLLILVIGLWFWIGRYYERHFGRVEALPKRGMEIALPLLLIGVIILENVLYRLHLAPPVSLIGLALGGTYIYIGLASLRWYYSLAGAVFVIGSLLPWMLGVGIGNQMFGSLGIVQYILLGSILILTGLYDHVRLVQAFKGIQGGLHAGDAR